MDGSDPMGAANTIRIYCRRRAVGRLAFLVLPLAQPYPRAATILVDELDARRFDRASNDLKRRTSWLTHSCLELMYRDNADACVLRQFLLVPSKEAACCSALCWRDHEGNLPKISDSHNSIKNLLTRK